MGERFRAIDADGKIHQSGHPPSGMRTSTGAWADAADIALGVAAMATADITAHRGRAGYRALGRCVPSGVPADAPKTRNKLKEDRALDEAAAVPGAWRHRLKADAAFLLAGQLIQTLTSNFGGTLCVPSVRLEVWNK